MQLIAKAKTLKPCCLRSCGVLCNQIYRTEHWKMQACSKAHARMVDEALSEFPVDVARKALELLKIESELEGLT